MRPTVTARHLILGLMAAEGEQLYLRSYHHAEDGKLIWSRYHHRPTATSIDRLLSLCKAYLTHGQPENVRLSAGTGGLDHLSVTFVIEGRLEQEPVD